jgi:hypothetical protein
MLRKLKMKRGKNSKAAGGKCIYNIISLIARHRGSSPVCQQDPIRKQVVTENAADYGAYGPAAEAATQIRRVGAVAPEVLRLENPV